MTAPDVSHVVAPARDASPLVGKDGLNDLLWEVCTYVELMGEAALAGTPLTLASSGMLAAVLAEPGITVAEMSRRIPKTQQAISQVAARLEKLGLLERRLGSGRGVGLFVTEAGRAMAKEGLAREQELQDRLCELLGDERCDALSRLLAEGRAILRDNR
ncbi:MAG: winged helix-turn-helix transcriptional regulator [Solirubrobacterales bacterium]|nr:winged helix-turn-helix transcriptional regulator [Solirubrobacterales bacterium]